MLATEAVPLSHVPPPVTSVNVADDPIHTLAGPEILGGVLDFILMDEQRLINFCETVRLRPEMPGIARRLLPGGEEVHWT